MTPSPKLEAAWRLDFGPGPHDGPGLVAGLVSGGRVHSAMMVGRESFGEAYARLAPETVFYVASLSKQFTAACIGILEASGALSLTDSIRRHVRGLPQAFESVELSHLLHHTSGVEAPRQLGPVQPNVWWMDVGLDDVIRDMVLRGAVVSVPGEAHVYVNEGYWLLAAAVQGASGESLAAFAEQRIFRPLGMTRTVFRDRPAPLPRPGVAVGHSPHQGQLKPVSTGFHVVGDGGLLTTLEDLARLGLFWSGRSSLGADLPRRMARPGVLNDGSVLQYAWGVSVRRHRHKPIISHGGDFIGYRAKFVRFPDQDFSVVVLANAETVDVDEIALRLADNALEGQIDPAAPSWAETLRPDGRAQDPSL